MDDLIKDLIDKAGLTDEQAKAALQVFLAYIKHEENRKKVVLAAVAATTASLVAARVV